MFHVMFKVKYYVSVQSKYCDIIIYYSHERKTADSTIHV